MFKEKEISDVLELAPETIPHPTVTLLYEGKKIVPPPHKKLSPVAVDLSKDISWARKHVELDSSITEESLAEDKNVLLKKYKRNYKFIPVLLPIRNNKVKPGSDEYLCNFIQDFKKSKLELHNKIEPLTMFEMISFGMRRPAREALRTTYIQIKHEGQVMQDDKIFHLYFGGIYLFRSFIGAKASLEAYSNNQAELNPVCLRSRFIETVKFIAKIVI